MRLIQKILLLCFIFSGPAFAQKTAKRRPANAAAPAASASAAATATTKPARPARPPAPNQLQMRIGPSIWQENIKVSNGTSKGNMETQSQGLLGSFAYLIPSSNRAWLQHYSADFGFGAIKGKGRSAAVPDELKGQLWLVGGFTPGLIYRTSPISAVGLLMPFSYRMIKYELKGGSSFNPDNDSSFSVGATGAYINQMSKNNYLYLSVTYHVLWAATAWNISWQYKLF